MKKMVSNQPMKRVPASGSHRHRKASITIGTRSESSKSSIADKKFGIP
jgi:hypothetical protein